MTPNNGTSCWTGRNWRNMGLANFPSDVRDSYRMLLPKFNALRVVIDEQKRNTRDILGMYLQFSKRLISEIVFQCGKTIETKQ